VASNRQLVAVMLTDVVGFATLTQQNEAAALELVEEQENLVRPLLQRYGGREVKTIGDAFLVEFESALAATRCAVDLQRGVTERNRRTTSPKLELRIGIHVGDVVRRETDIYGDTVNIVSRITPTADPGGISVSSPVYEQVRNKIDFAFRPLGGGALKHIDLPVSIYRVELPWLANGKGRLSPWTGRDAELDVVRRKIDSTQRGEGGILVLAGDVGVGKSRLAEEAIKHAQRNGFRVLRGRALPGEPGLAYSHWSDAARDFLRVALPQLVYKVCGTHGAELARLVPEITEVIGPTPPGPALEPEQARFRFFRGITDFFENISKEGPLLLFFDELQWADPASLRLLQQAAPQLSTNRLLLMAAYTDSEVDRSGPFQEVLHSLHRDHLLTRVRLSPFDRATTETFVANLLGDGRTSSSIITLLHDMTGGNPFYIEEMLQSLIEDGTVFRTPTGGWDRKPAGEFELPQSIREVVQRRIHSLGEEDRRLLSIAAVLGMEFKPALLAEVAGIQESDLVDPLERMLRAQVIKERALSHTQVTYSFTDSQVRALLYEDLSFLRRRGYHQKAAEALEAHPRGPENGVAGEIEFHYLRGNDPGKALEYAVKAAERAAHLYSHEDSIRHYRTALELLDVAGDERRKCELLKLVADQEFYLSHIAPGVRALRESAEGFDKLGDRMRAADLFRQVADWTVSWLHDPATARELYDRARTILEGQPEGRELAALYLDMAGVLYAGGRMQEYADTRAKAQALVERLGDPELEVQIELMLASDATVREKEKVFEHLRRAEDIVIRNDLRDWLPQVCFSFGLKTLEVRGDTNQAQDWFQRSIDAARKVGDVGFDAGVGKHMFAYVAIKRGELQKAARLTDELLEFLKENFPHLPPQHLCGLSDIAVLLGDYDRAAELLGYFDAQPPESVGSYCRMRTRNVRGHLSRSTGKPADAEAAFSTTLELYRRDGRTAGGAALGAEALLGLVEARLDLGNVASAQAALDELAILAREFDEAIGYGFWYAAEGAMAAYRNDPEKAAAAFLKSLNSWRQLGWRYNLAVGLRQLGAMYLGSGNPTAASEPLRQALESFTEMGAKADAARALELANKIST
jgi:class 3 adenylate cyclase/tetratricopeptide (TPR) repeat protein